MAQIFPGILYATVAAIPGWIVGAFAASPALLRRPIGENVKMILEEAPMIYLIFTAATLSYGTAAWMALRMLDFLNLASLVLAALLPVIVYVYVGIIRRGFDARSRQSVITLGIPAALTGAALWFYTVASPA